MILNTIQQNTSIKSVTLNFRHESSADQTDLLQ